MRIKTKEIAGTRTDLLQQQGMLCALCAIDCSADPVLDHCHKTGAIRAVLHRQCNAYLGRLENNAARHGVRREELSEFLKCAASYLETHSVNQTGLLHPLHLTAEEKLERRKRRAKKSRAAKKKLLDD